MDISGYPSSEEAVYDNFFYLNLDTKLCGLMVTTETSALVCNVKNYGQSHKVKLGHS